MESMPLFVENKTLIPEGEAEGFKIFPMIKVDLSEQKLLFVHRVIFSTNLNKL